MGNNTGPGSYNLRYHTKNSKSIDRRKTADNIKKDNNKNKFNKKIIDLEKLKIDTQVNTFNKFINKFENTYNNGTNHSRNRLNMNIEKFTNKICNNDLSDNIEEKTKKNKFEIKIEELPGHEDYEIKPYINVPICFSNVTNEFEVIQVKDYYIHKKEINYYLDIKIKNFYLLLKIT